MSGARRSHLLVVGLALAAAAVLARPAAKLPERVEVSVRLPGSPSAAVQEALAARFASPYARSAILVATGLPGVGTPAGRAALGEIVADVRAVPGVVRTYSPLDRADPLLVGARGDGAIVLAGLDGPGNLDPLVDRLRAATAERERALRVRHPAARLRWTGEAALNLDLRRASAAEVRLAERRALPLTLLLLVAVFGALVAALVPLGAGALAIVASLGVLSLAALAWRISGSVQAVVSMMGLGLGIDYSLLAVGRFREARRDGATVDGAARAARRHAGRTVALSGLSVAIGFLGLAFVPVTELRSLALGGIVVVAASVTVAAVVVPAVLGLAGGALEWGRLPLARRRGDGGRWRRWGALVTARPRTVAVLAGLPVLLLAFQATRMRVELPRGAWVPSGIEAGQGLLDLRVLGRGGIVQTIRVVVELPAGTDALDPAGWSAVRALQAHLAADPRVARVQSLPGLLESLGGSRAALPLLPREVRAIYVSTDRRAALVEIVPGEAVEAADLTAFVRELRARDAAALTGLPGTRLLVGGLPALNADFQAAVAGRLPLVVFLVVGGTFLSLLVAFRSVLIALKAVALNLVSVGGALGLLVLVFQEGHGARWLGLSGGTGAIFPTVPLVVFCVVFGLSMDYEVFLVARVAEARRAGADDALGITTGLVHTAGTITGAAAIMVAVFGSFALGGFLLIQMLGVALSAAVLLDATVVRIALGPALLMLAGRYNWWPGERVPTSAPPPSAAPARSPDSAGSPPPSAASSPRGWWRSRPRRA